MPLAELTGGDHALLEAAREVIRRNYDAAERLHTVGAAVRCGSGRVYTGVNVYALHGACAAPRARRSSPRAGTAASCCATMRPGAA